MTAASETPPARRKEPSNRTTIGALAELLDLPSWETIDELNRDSFYAECAASAVTVAKEHEGITDPEELDERALAAEQAAETEVFGQWYDAVLAAARSLYGEHGLEIEPLKVKGAPVDARCWDLRVVPAVSWIDAATKIMTTIEGVGIFGYGGNVKEFLASGPYTPRRAVLDHLHWIKRYPDVYGTRSARTIYEGAWR